MEERDAERRKRRRYPGSRQPACERPGRDEDEEDANEEEKRERGERPRNLRFHLVARACPSRFSSSPGPRGWGPRETRPPAGSGPVTVPSLSLFVTPLSLPFSTSVVGTVPWGPTGNRLNPFPAQRTAIQHSRVMLLEPDDPRE